MATTKFTDRYWWYNAFYDAKFWGNLPARTWVWTYIPHIKDGGPYSRSTLNDLAAWPGGAITDRRTYYWIFKIPRETSGRSIIHYEQVAIRTPEYRKCTAYESFSGKVYTVKLYPNKIYILTQAYDTPNYGTISNAVTIMPFCRNWFAKYYEVDGEYERAQSCYHIAAIRTQRAKNAQTKAAIASNRIRNIYSRAAIRGDRQKPISVKSAIRGDRNMDSPVRSAIRAELVIEHDTSAAVAKDFSLELDHIAAVRGNPWVYVHQRAAIKGEAETYVNAVAYIVKSRKEAIMLEMENLWPQAFDLRSVPNWSSDTRDYRKDPLV
jgi:hypothetical protein